MANRMRPIHPGEILAGELEETGMSANALAKALGVPANRIGAILNAQARHHRRYGAQARPLLRHDAGVLAQPSAEP